MDSQVGGPQAVPGVQEPAAGGHRLSLVIPACNEQETIRQAIREAVAALSPRMREFEVIVVDDGSSDDTAEVVRAEAATNPSVRLLQHPRKLGYGAAPRSGFQAATMDLVAFTDADCQFDLTELEYLVPLTHHYDIVCGSRIDDQESALRRFMSLGYNSLVRLLTGTEVRDIGCALKVFHRDQLPVRMPERNALFVRTELLTRARLEGLSVVEAGVHHRRRAVGFGRVSVPDIPRNLAALVSFWWSQVLCPAPARSGTPFG